MRTKCFRLTYGLLLCVLLAHTIRVQANDETNISYRWNADSTITFTYWDSTACRVSLRGNCMLPHEDLSFAGRQACKKMQQVSPGVWECTTPRQLSPGLYTYRIIVDGRKRTDPNNPDSIYVRNHRRSVLIVDGDAQTALYKPCTPRGQVETVRFLGTTGNTFRLMVYLPPNYQDTIIYPVVYLLHGINGDERNWVEQGRIGNILDNLIANGEIRPVIAVMPRCLLSQPRHDDHVQATNVFNYGEILRGGFERQFYEIENYVLQHYSVQSQGNAIAGLSCGARQAANIANRDTSLYDYVGMFSPVVTKKQLPVAQTTHYWVGGGSNDWMFLADARGYARELKRLGIAHVYLELQGGHTFNNWRIFVTEFMRWAYPQCTI